LPPYSFYFDLDYDGTFPRKGQPDHLFVQEYELGLPCRFQVAWEFYQEAINGHRQIPFTLVEGRYAFADWGKIPLNPTLLAEFKWGTGKDYFGKETDRGGDSGEGNVTKSISNSYEVRLLLGQEIRKSLEFASNIFFEQKLSGDREREAGFSTAWSYALRGEALKVGLETKYSNESQPGKRHLARNIFQLGPAFTYKPSPHNFQALLVEGARLGIPKGKLLHVAQSLFHDHVPAKAAGLPTVWINRRQGRPGSGATPEPEAPVRPDWTFPSLAAFADAVESETR